MENEERINVDFLKSYLFIESKYEPSRFCESFYDFAERINTLNRYWIVSRDYIEQHLHLVNNGNLSDVAETLDKEFTSEEGCPAALGDCLSDLRSSDSLYFPETIRLNILITAFSFFENLLGNICDEVADLCDLNVKLDERQMPYIDKQIRWLTRCAGLNIIISKEQRKQLDLHREVRNKYIHRLSRELPDNIQKTVDKIVSEVNNPDWLQSSEYIDSAIDDIIQLVSQIEIAYWKFYEESDKGIDGK